jgi:hypothetical protein
LHGTSSSPHIVPTIHSTILYTPLLLLLLLLLLHRE